MKLALILLFCIPAFGSDIFFASSSAGSNNGTSCANAYAVADATHGINNTTNSQVAGNTLHLCGTFSSAVQGGTLVTAGASGTSGNPITVKFETGAQLVSTGWWGNYNNSGACPSCTGAITINGYNYWVIDGGTNGLIENTLAGCTSGCDNGVAATCAGGTCTQSPGSVGSLGIHIDGDNITVKNLTIGPIYVNAGTLSGSTDVGGQFTVNIRVDGSPTNLQINNNTLITARAGIWGGFAGTAGPTSCPSAGICIFNNKFADHAWGMTLNTAVSAVNVSVYGNQMGDTAVSGLTGWLNWQNPTGTYHQDGIFLWGSTTSQVITAYIWNNQIIGDLGQGSPSGLIYCANTGLSDSSGCAMTAWNNVVVQTGSTQWPNDAYNDQVIAVKLDGTPYQMGPIVLYNNTLLGGEFSLELYNEPGDASFALTAENNLFEPGVVGTQTRWFYHQENSGSPFSSVTASYNDYYNGNNLAWNYNGTQASSLSAWQTACSCDNTGSFVTAPNISSAYLPNSGSPLISAGGNLTSLGSTLPSITTDLAGNSRPSSGAWTIGAYNFSGFLGSFGNGLTGAGVTIR